VPWGLGMGAWVEGGRKWIFDRRSFSGGEAVLGEVVPGSRITA